LSRGSIRGAFVVGLALVCCACSSRPLQGVLVPNAQSSPDTSRVTIFAATTRQRLTDDPGEMFGADPATAMSYAAIGVSIPSDDAREVGQVQWPTTLPGDPAKNFVTVSADNLDPKSFSAALSKTIKQTGRRNVLLFVHGFNNRFDEAVYRFAQISHDSKAPGIPVLFSWPSRGQVSLVAYRSDREQASNSREALTQLLHTLAANPDVKEITVLAHSMGCWLTLQALVPGQGGRLSPKIKNVLFVAPDVSTDDFKTWLQQVGRPRPRIALFVSKDDQALKISQSIWGGTPRLGDADPNEEPYRSEFEKEGILAFDLTNLKGNPHSRAFDDVQTVMGLIEQRFAQGQSLTGPRQEAITADE
jgi:esterase/lipase superfamily enzyme